MLACISWSLDFIAVFPMAHRWSHLCFLTADRHIVPAKHLPDCRYADEIRIQQTGKSTCFSVVLSPHVEDPCCPTINGKEHSWWRNCLLIYVQGLQLLHWIWHRNTTPLVSDTRTHARSLESGPFFFINCFFLITKDASSYLSCWCCPLF